MSHAGKTRSTDAAMELLHRYQSSLILRGRWEAIRRCAASTVDAAITVDSRWVAERMASLGILQDSDGRHWTGAVFNVRGLWRWTGRLADYEDVERNAHAGRMIKVWTLADGWREWCAKNGVDPDAPPAEAPRPAEAQQLVLL